MTGLTLSLVAGDGAEAASQSIRLRAYVPVFCALKRVAPHGFAYHGRGPGHGKFKIVCNTPYHMHMEGAWRPPGWPHVPFFSHTHAEQGLDVELRVVGNDSALDTHCALAPGRDGGCRAFQDDSGAIPPMLGQAQVTVETPRDASARDVAGSGRATVAQVGEENREQNNGGAPGARAERPWHWQRRMGLGALPRVASASRVPYVPRYLLDAARADGVSADASRHGSLERAEQQAGARADEPITVYLTLTGRY